VDLTNEALIAAHERVWARLAALPDDGSGITALDAINAFEMTAVADGLFHAASVTAANAWEQRMSHEEPTLPVGLALLDVYLIGYLTGLEAQRGTPAA
jgi:hypothetical protein